MENNDLMLEDALADLYGEASSLRFERNWREAVRREEQLQMKNKKNIWLKTVLPIAAALVLILGANWAGGMMDGFPYETRMQEAQNAKLMSGSTASYGAAPSSSLAGGYGAVNYAVEESYDAEAAYDSVSFSATAARDAGAPEAAPVPQPQQERKLIRTVDISLRTETFESDVAGIQQLLAEYGGYIESMYQQGEAGGSYGRSANLTMRVPSDKLDAFLNGISSYGRVTSRSENTEDMTEQYADNETRIQTLKTKMERLQTLLSQAEQVSDILEIESEIADTQYQLERYETKQLNIDRRVDMSYVYVNVTETVPQEAADDDELTLGQRLKAAFMASLVGLGRFARNLLVFLVMALPVIVPVGIVVLVIWLVRRKRKAQPEAAADEGNADEDTAE
jgi:hypothetical protein